MVTFCWILSILIVVLYNSIDTASISSDLDSEKEDVNGKNLFFDLSPLMKLEIDHEDQDRKHVDLNVLGGLVQMDFGQRCGEQKFGFSVLGFGNYHDGCEDDDDYDEDEEVDDEIDEEVDDEVDDKVDDEVDDEEDIDIEIQKENDDDDDEEYK